MASKRLPRLRAFRLQAGLSADDAAERLGVKVNTLYSWERASRIPQEPGMPKRLADLYGVAITDLWPLEEEEVAA